jgi:sulfatase modifying factor 1
VKLRFLLLPVLVIAAALPAGPQQAEKPLTQEQVMQLVRAEMNNVQLAKLVRERGIDFEPTEDYIQALRKAGAQDVLIEALHALKPQPLTKDQVLHLVAGGVPSERAAALVKQRGIDFLPDAQYLETLRLAGGDNTVIAAVREAGAAATGKLEVTTSPNAEVYLDGEPQGWANAQGKVTIKAKLGAHTLKVLLKGKKDSEQSVTLASMQTTEVAARLVDAPGSIRLRTLADARVLLDGTSRGITDASGELVLSDVPAGPHELRVSAPEKTDYVQSVTVSPGQETRAEATLHDAPPSPGQVRENPKDGLKYVWIPAGTFTMGCSPGDSECRDDEKPPHAETLAKGFWVGQTEVTVAGYIRFTTATGRTMPSAPSFAVGWTKDLLPMVNMSWDDAHDYCIWAGGRLPTEAEWEFAARAGSASFRYGPSLDAVAWFAENSGRPGIDIARLWKKTWGFGKYYKELQMNGNQPHEVAQKLPNAFGLYDVLGNVAEWVDAWGSLSGSKEQYRIVRGGAWDRPEFNERLSGRMKGLPGSREVDDDIGCRCVWELSSP